MFDIKEFISEYTSYIDENPNYIPDYLPYTLLGKCVNTYLIIEDQEVKDVLLKMIKILLKGGSDPSIGKGTSIPLKMAEMFEDKDLYNLLLNESLTNYGSATEAKLSDRIKQGLSNAKQVLGNRWNKAMDKAERGLDINQTTNRLDQIDNANKRVDSVKASLPNWITTLPDQSIKDQIEEILIKDPNYEKSYLYETIWGFQNKGITPGVEGAKLLLNKKYGGSLMETLKINGFDGLETGDNLLKQLKVISYYKDKNIPVSEIRKDSKWLTKDQMESLINKKAKEAGNYDKDKKTGSEIIKEELKSNTINEKILKDYLTNLGYRKETVEKVFSEKIDEFERLLNSNFETTELSDSRTKLKNQISRIFRDSQPKPNDKPSGLDIVKGEMGKDKILTSDLAKFFEDNHILSLVKAKDFIYRNGELVRDLLKKKYEKVLANDDPKAKFIKELRNSLMGNRSHSSKNNSNKTKKEVKISKKLQEARDSAISGLMGLGLKKGEATNAVNSAKGTTPEEIVLEVLRKGV